MWCSTIPIDCMTQYSETVQVIANRVGRIFGRHCLVDYAKQDSLILDDVN
jgi:hypothetical protein